MCVILVSCSELKENLTLNTHSCLNQVNVTLTCTGRIDVRYQESWKFLIFTPQLKLIQNRSSIEQHMLLYVNHTKCKNIGFLSKNVGI